jgi:spermidine synthase
VEIDPAVYKYAREFFSLPEPQAVYLEDARQWVHEHSPLPADEKYDYIVHDCFSGGGVPEHIFTIEFWEELKGVVKSDGIIAVVGLLLVCYRGILELFL